MKLNSTFLLILLCNLSIGCKAQNKWQYSEYRVYDNLKKALKNKTEGWVLDLSNEGLKELPIGVTQLENLKVLILNNNNKLSSLPEEIGNLKNLERLELMNNNLGKLPFALTELKKLKRLNVAYNNIYEEEVKFLGKALPKCFIITQIDL